MKYKKAIKRLSHINPKNAFVNGGVCAMSEGYPPDTGRVAASNKGILRISIERLLLVCAYKLTKDLKIIYSNPPLYLRWIAGLSQ